jgi:hypothetical protein
MFDSLVDFKDLRAICLGVPIGENAQKLPYLWGIRKG